MNAQLIFSLLNAIDATFKYLLHRGLSKDRIQTMLHEAENGDLTTEQVQAELDNLDAELAETANLIGNGNN